MSEDLQRPFTYPTRHPWPRRVFLTLFLADMFLRGIGWSVYDWHEEATELHMDAVPGESVAAFANPVPGEKTRAELSGAGVYARYSLTWLVTRGDYFGQLMGISQAWPMFSPNVSDARTLPRLRLIYADGSTRIVRSITDPEDLLRASHWFDEKRLDFELAAGYDNPARRGWANVAANRYPENESGSRLQTIEVFNVRYTRPKPGNDWNDYLRRQTGPPAEQIGPVVWRYDVKTRRGKVVESSPAP